MEPFFVVMPLLKEVFCLQGGAKGSFLAVFRLKWKVFLFHKGFSIGPFEPIIFNAFYSIVLHFHCFHCIFIVLYLFTILGTHTSEEESQKQVSKLACCPGHGFS